MTLYTDLRDGIFEWTKRPDLTADTDMAIRQAVRNAHKSGTFWRDLAEEPVTGLAIDQSVQSIDLTAFAAPFRKILKVGVTGTDQEYTKADALDLLDGYGVKKVDVFWLFGNYLKIRAAAPVEAVTVEYFRHWTVVPITALDSWIPTYYPDLIICSAAASIAAGIDQQDIKTRVEKIAADELALLIAENTTQG